MVGYLLGPASYNNILDFPFPYLIFFPERDREESQPTPVLPFPFPSHLPSLILNCLSSTHSLPHPIPSQRGNPSAGAGDPHDSCRPTTTTMTTSPPSSKTKELLPPLHAVGFEIDVVSAEEVTGTLKVTETCCQPFKVLHGGVSAMISEGLASVGAHMASGFARIAGIQLSINHHRSARLGDLVFVRAAPLQVGKTIQVWEVHLWKMDPSTQEKGVLLASSKVTFLSNMAVPENAKDAGDALKKYARL